MNTGIVSENGELSYIVIGGVTYSGLAYSTAQIQTALEENDLVATQDVTLERFDISPGKTFIGDKLDMSGSTSENGGAIFNQGTMAISEGTFSADTASEQGGAIVNQGTTTISECLFSDNEGVGGGAFLNQGTATVSDCTFSNNVAPSAGGAVSNVNLATFSNCLFTGSTAGASGGAIYTDRDVTFVGGTFTDNVAPFGGAIMNLGGGRLTLVQCAFIGNTAQSASGAIYSDGIATISESTFIGNVSVEGGAIANVSAKIAVMTLTDSTFIGNTAETGGALISLGTATISGCTFTGNMADYGGAIVNLDAATISNCTFEGNTATEQGGAVYNEGETVIDGCVFNGNLAVYGGAIYNAEECDITVRNSVFGTDADSICNDGTAVFCGTNTLNAALNGDGQSCSGEEDTVLTGTGTVEQKYIAQGYKTAFEELTLTNTVVGGCVDQAAPNAIELNFHDVSMTDETKIYGAGEANGTAIEVNDVTLNFTGTGMNARALVCAGGAASGATAKLTAGTVTVNADISSGDMGVLFGGANLANGGSFQSEEVNTTVSGNATWLSFVGNGSRNGNSAIGSVTTDVSRSVVTIDGGVFENLVYAGVYAAGDNVTVGSTELNISGGTFNYMLFGGNGGADQQSTKNGKSVVSGDVKIKVDVTDGHSVVFNRTLFAGSFGEGTIGGCTYMTFTGNGANLIFDSEHGYVSGGSQQAWHSATKFETYVAGGTAGSQDKDSRYLKFDDFTGAFGANMSNGFSNVCLDGDSSVVFAGADVELDHTKVWEFAIGTGDKTMLAWEKGQNDFDGDEIRLSFEGSGFDGEVVLLDAGTNADILNGWDKALSVSLGALDNKLAWNGTDAYLGSYDGKNYKLYSEGNKLMLAFNNSVE